MSKKIIRILWITWIFFQPLKAQRQKCAFLWKHWHNIRQPIFKCNFKLLCLTCRLTLTETMTIHGLRPRFSVNWLSSFQCSVFFLMFKSENSRFTIQIEGKAVLHSTHGCADNHRESWTGTQRSIMRVMLTHVLAGTFSEPFAFFFFTAALYQRNTNVLSSVYTQYYKITKWKSRNENNCNITLPAEFRALPVPLRDLWQQLQPPGFSSHLARSDLWIFLCRLLKARFGIRHIKKIHVPLVRERLNGVQGQGHVMNLAQVESSQGEETSRRWSREM